MSLDKRKDRTALRAASESETNSSSNGANSDVGALERSTIRNFFASLDTPRALTSWLLYESGEHVQLSQLTFNPHEYNDLENARSALAATKFLSKFSGLSTNVDTSAVAFQKFLKAEDQCRHTNERISRNDFKNNHSAGVLMHMRHQIETMFSGVITPDLFVDSCGWGPGATTLLPRSQVSSPKKFSYERKINRRGYEFVKPWFHLAFPHWDLTFEIDGESKIIFVSKDATSDRTIEIQPGLCLWFQKSIGSIMRNVLKRNGIDLNSQVHNQKKARVASIFNTITTCDFSSASDTISYRLVEEAIPSQLFTLLDVFRTDTGRVKGNSECIAFQKFSAMGNGYTFELETLLFYTMAVACCGILGIDHSGVSVFGDDVILPTAAYDLYCSVSADLGFTINSKKSHSDSYYRESCGEHYWNGVDIKPIFHKEPLHDKTSIILLANNIRRLSHRRSSSGCDSSFRYCYQVLTHYLGQRCPRISEGYGDVGLIENLDESVGVTQASTRTDGTITGYEGFYVNVWAVSASQKEVCDAGMYLSKMHSLGRSRVLSRSSTSELFGTLGYLTTREMNNFLGLETSFMGNNIPINGRMKLTRKRLLIPRWHDLGPWV